MLPLYLEWGKRGEVTNWGEFLFALWSVSLVSQGDWVSALETRLASFPRIFWCVWSFSTSTMLSGNGFSFDEVGHGSTTLRYLRRVWTGPSRLLYPRFLGRGEERFRALSTHPRARVRPTFGPRSVPSRKPGALRRSDFPSESLCEPFQVRRGGSVNRYSGRWGGRSAVGPLGVAALEGLNLCRNRAGARGDGQIGRRGGSEWGTGLWLGPRWGPPPRVLRVVRTPLPPLALLRRTSRPPAGAAQWVAFLRVRLTPEVVRAVELGRVGRRRPRPRPRPWKLSVDNRLRSVARDFRRSICSWPVRDLWRVHGLSGRLSSRFPLPQSPTGCLARESLSSMRLGPNLHLRPSPKAYAFLLDGRGGRRAPPAPGSPPQSGTAMLKMPDYLTSNT